MNDLGAMVYPRWRGEHPPTLSTGAKKIGLSPLARGTQQRDRLDQRQVRFIPAGAGNTAAQKAGKKLEAVYPRWRGEHTKRI